MSALEDARGYLNYQWGTLDGSGTEAECVGRPVDAAARAVLALAEEQRTANLLALLTLPSANISTEAKTSVLIDVVDRLGLGTSS